MRFTRFDIFCGEDKIRSTSFNCVAIDVAKDYAAKHQKTVKVVGIDEDGDSSAVYFHPNGESEKIWRFDRGKLFIPLEGNVYINNGGGRYRCLESLGNGSGVFQSTDSGWTFTAKGTRCYIDGTIDWEHSTNGRFEK